MSTHGWKNKLVKHADGRAGRIVGEYTGFCHIGLKIAVEGGGEAFIQLNANGPDTGEAGWEWWCETFSDGPRFLLLAD